MDRFLPFCIRFRFVLRVKTLPVVLQKRNRFSNPCNPFVMNNVIAQVPCPPKKKNDLISGLTITVGKEHKKPVRPSVMETRFIRKRPNISQLKTQTSGLCTLKYSMECIFSLTAADFTCTIQLQSGPSFIFLSSQRVRGHSPSKNTDFMGNVRLPNKVP
jgi:hypothetical protein